MSYMALYRKWRPDMFEEVKGQEHIVTTLKNQIKHDRIGHAYIFCGTRGTGKTTIAKLFAKSVNCEHPVDGSPCNECESCKAISRGSSMNVIEIDAASNNGVDNIRQINDAVQYSPSQGKYLVYIIDEVHMLSVGAFNALLKTLEEPPAYVIFILATTESHKIPITIMSRCQRYDFRRITIETIRDRLDELLKRENVAATKEALQYVAKAADGSMRDALSILDQCISFNLGEELTFDRVLNTIGAVDIDVFIRLMDYISSDDMIRIMDTVEEVVWQGRDIGQFVNDFIWFIRNMLFIKLSGGMATNLDLTKENIERLAALGEGFSEEVLIRYMNILKELAAELKYSTMKRVSLEIALIKICRPESENDYLSMKERLDKLEKKTKELEDRPVVVNNVVASAPQNGISNGSTGAVNETMDSLTDEEKMTRANEALKNRNYQPADIDMVKKILGNWEMLDSSLGRGTASSLKYFVQYPGADPGEIDLIFDKALLETPKKFHYSYIEEHKSEIEDAIKELYECNVKINIKALAKSDIKSNVFNGIVWQNPFDFDGVKYED